MAKTSSSGARGAKVTPPRPAVVRPNSGMSSSRSNKGGAVRGQARAAQVKAMNKTRRGY